MNSNFKKMEDNISPVSFTPNRPSFPLTPGDPPLHSTYQNNSHYDMQHQGRVCYQNGMVPPYIQDHRMFHGVVMNVVMPLVMVNYGSYRVFDHQPVFMEQMHQPLHPPFVHVPWKPPLDQLHLLQNIDPAMLSANNPNLYSGGDQRFINVARSGYDLFRNDILEENDRVEFPGIKVNGVEEDEGSHVFKLSGLEVGRKMGVEPLGGEFKNVRFCVDNRDYVDTRNVVNLVGEGEKEYKLFEAGLNPIRDVMKEVYNLNSVEFMDPREISGVQVLPQTLRKWPLEINGANWEGLGQRIVNFNVCSGEGKGEKKFLSKAGEFGIEALAKLYVSLNGGRELPFGVVLLTGINVDKLIRDLDGEKMITCGFPGPLADRNLVLDFGGNEVTSGFKEYNLPFVSDGHRSALERHEWTARHRITRNSMKLLSFETIMFVFYTFTGDALQLLAAKEAYSRGWRYHKVHQVWISPWVDGAGWDVGSNEGVWESGVYKYFHYGKWVYCKAEFKISPGVLEGKPVEVFDALWE